MLMSIITILASIEQDLEAGTRSHIQARLSGMNISYSRTSKLVSDFCPSNGI